MLSTSVEQHYKHFKQRVEAIVNPIDMPDNLLFDFLLHQYMKEVERDTLTPAERLIVLDRYVAWYAKNGKKPPFPEWVTKNRERWQALIDTTSR